MTYKVYCNLAGHTVDHKNKDLLVFIWQQMGVE